MIKNIFQAFAAGLFLFCGTAFAASLQPGSGVVLETPDNWNTLDRDFTTLVHPAVNQMLNCLDTDPAELKQVGWLLDGSALQSAYCVSFRQSGMARALHILKTAKGSDREAAADKFADTFAGVIQAGYNRRGVQVETMNAEIIDAGADIVVVMDGILHTEAGDFLRSETVFLHGDTMLSIGTVYDRKVPQDIVGQLEAIPLSVQWGK